MGLEGGGGVLIHGGDTFDGRKREPVSDMFLFMLKPHIHWFNLGDSGIGRAGHVILASRDQVIIHGGFAGKHDVVMSDCYTLQVTETQRDMSSGGDGVKGQASVKSGKEL